MNTSKKKETWDMIIESLGAKLPKGEFRTWFSRTSLKKLDNNMAIINVPNKFVATWLSDNYLTELKRIIKKLTRSSPSIHFSFESRPTVQTNHYVLPSLPSKNGLKQRLNPRLTFDGLSIGQPNRFAFTSARALAEHGQDEYNLLYIHSKPGLGKTHLLHAIGNQRLKKEPSCRVRYLSSDAFSSEFTYAVNNENLDVFRREYCDLDLLLFDDIHLLAHHEKTQEEFLFIFNSLYSGKKQIVVTGDGPPNRLKDMSSELRSRLGWGLLADIQTPNQEMKMDIIRTNTAEIPVNIPDDVLFFLANSSSDVKSLVKNLIKLETYSSIGNGNITISIVKTLTKDSDRSGIDLEDIINTAAGYFNISVADLISHKKKRLYSYPRQLAMYLARAHTGLSYKDIGRSFGNKDHSTAIYAIKRIEELKVKEKKIRKDLKILESLLG
jgi:chromosomal replication initiator protein